MPGNVEISITARDNASAPLDKVRQQLEMFPTFARNVDAVGPPLDRANRGFEGLDISASKAARGIRSLAAPIIGELSPALGQVGSQMASVITTAALLGSGMGALAIGAAALAGIVGGKLVDAWQKASAETLAYQRALESGDLTRVTAQVEKLTQKIIEQSEAIRGTRRDYAGAASRGYFSPAEQQQAELDKDIDKQTAARALRDRLRDVEVPGGTAAALNEILGANARTTFSLQQSQRGLYDFTLPGPDAALADALRRADDLENGPAPGVPGDPEAAAKLRAAARAQYARTQALTGARLFGRSTPGAVSDYEGAFFGDTAQGDVRQLLQQIQDRENLRELDLLRNRREVLGEDAVSDYGETVFGDAGQAKARSAIEATVTAQLERQLSITQSMATYNSTLVDLGLQQRESLSLQAIEHERILKLQIAGTDEAKKLAAEVEAAVKRQQVLEATDPVAGLKRGITDLEVAWGSAGLRMQAMAHEMGGGIASALGDSMFGPLEERMKNLPPLFRGILTAMARAVTDDIGKAITAQLFSGLKGLLPGGGTAGLFPFAEGARSGGGPLLTTTGRPLAQSELDAAYAAGGDAGVRALRSGDAAVVGGEFVPARYGLTSPEITQSAYALPSTAGSRFNLRSGLGIAGGAAALGLTAYAATGAQSDLDIGASAALGGLTGATLGAQVGGLFDAGGAGGGIGALAGAAIAGTIALLAKQEADKAAKKAKAGEELARAAGAGSDLVRSAGSATSIQDLFRRITAAGSGYTGGTANPAVSTTVQTPTGPRPIGVPNPTYPVATLADLLAAPESLQANIQAGVDPSQLAEPNAATSEALQAIARDLVDQYQTAAQGVGLTQEDRVGGLTRRVTVPASRADMLDPTRDVEVDALALAELDEDTRTVLLMNAMARLAVEQDIQSTISDGATGQIVSITRIPRSTIALPPGTPGGPPAGVPPGAIPAIGQAAALNIPQFTEAPPRGPALYGAPLYDYVQEGEGGTYVQQPGNTGPITGYAAPSAEQVAAYNARRAEFYAPHIQALTTEVTDQLRALTPAQVQAAINAGLLSPAAAASLVQAGLLPEVAAALPPDVLAALMAEAGDGATPSTGGPSDLSGLAFQLGFTGQGPTSSLLSGFQAALSGATFGLLGDSNVSMVQAIGAKIALALGTLAGMSTGVGAVAGLGINFGLGFLNSAIANAAIAANPAAFAAGIVNSAAASTGLTPSGLSAADFGIGVVSPAQAAAAAGLAAITAAVSNGQAFATLSVAQATALGQSGFSLPDGNVAVPTGYVAGTPTEPGAPGGAGSGAGPVGGGPPGGTVGEGDAPGSQGA